MIIDRFLQQTATLKRSNGTDSYGEQTYASGVSIAVRWFYENKMVRDTEGREVVSTAHISTKESISTQDLVTDEDGRDREVIAVRKNRDVRGVFSHFVASLK